MCLNRYFELMDQYPKLFENNSSILTIIKDRKVIENYVKESGKQIGVVYESLFHIFVVDLVKDINDRYYAYERIIHHANGVLIIPMIDNQYILLNQYRHALRRFQYSFPRGFGEVHLTSEENAIKELKEELHANINKIEYVSSIVTDSGLSGDRVDVFKAELSEFKVIQGYEGIEDILLVSHDELKNMILNHKIDDSMTLAALQLLSQNKSL